MFIKSRCWFVYTTNKQLQGSIGNEPRPFFFLETRQVSNALTLHLGCDLRCVCRRCGISTLILSRGTKWIKPAVARRFRVINLTFRGGGFSFKGLINHEFKSSRVCSHTASCRTSLPHKILSPISFYKFPWDYSLSNCFVLAVTLRLLGLECSSCF